MPSGSLRKPECHHVLGVIVSKAVLLALLQVQDKRSHLFMGDLASEDEVSQAAAPPRGIVVEDGRGFELEVKWALGADLVSLRSVSTPA